ncbi:MAG: geranylgeranyl reductase family protein [Anaerolineales bacterium]|nr:geranylgeranyl reductase family protein [Anaerolineales bacterium]
MSHQTKKIYDIIIVGAGPAGAVLAYLLAKIGLRVLILEKARLPRYKTCGGGVTYKTVENLPFDVTPALNKEASGGIVTFEGAPLLKTLVKRPFAWLVMRDSFDHFLTQEALRAGAELIEASPVERIDQQPDYVTVHTNAGNFTGLFMAGADGVNSTVARLLGMLQSREVGTAIEAEIEVSPHAMDEQGQFATFDFGAIPHGYGWIFPKSDHLSVGIYHATTGKVSDLRQSLQHFIDCQPVLNQPCQLSMRGHQIPLGGVFNTLHQGRVLLLGDAANLADPWLGEGLYYAVASARIAATVIEELLSQGQADLKCYTQRINSEIVQQLAYARRLANLVYQFPRYGSHLISKSSLMQNLIFGTIRGDYTFDAVNRLLLQSMPRIWWQAISYGGSQP